MKNDKKIRMKWSRSKDDSVSNFGDDLGPYIVQKLSGKQIDYIYFANSRFKITKQFISELLSEGFSMQIVRAFMKSFFISEYLITVGSILQWYSSKRCIVWGAGVIDSSNVILPAKRYCAVRGYYTKEKIIKLGFNENIAIGDPALLMPKVYLPTAHARYRLGIIPHYIHYEAVRKMELPKDVLVIKLDAPNVEKIIDDILSCEYTISTSLHGLIVSHAYNIKSLWYNIEEPALYGDNIKFMDYFSSVNIPEYKPFIFQKKEKIDIAAIINNILHNESINLPKIDLNEIQEKLIDSAPFYVQPHYRSLKK